MTRRVPFIHPFSSDNGYRGLKEGEKAPADGRSLDVLVPVLAGPDQLVAILAFDFCECCVDRSREARVVQLDREVVAVSLLGALLPGGSQFDIMWSSTMQSAGLCRVSVAEGRI